MTAPFITVTGADEHTDIEELAKLDAEIGFLYSASQQTSRRYPRMEWIQRAVSFVERAALHVCGIAARRELLEGRIRVCNFQRIQVNGTVDLCELRDLCQAFPDHEIITQYNARTTADIVDFPASNHALLVDSSGGHGILPAKWERPATSKPLGFAGGLGPANLWDQLSIIRPPTSNWRTGFWVDMESSLRLNDRFSVQRARQCTEIFHRALCLWTSDAMAKQLNKLNKALDHLAPKGTWLAEVLHNIWTSDDLVHAIAIAQRAVETFYKLGIGDQLCVGDWEPIPVDQPLLNSVLCQPYCVSPQEEQEARVHDSMTKFMGEIHSAVHEATTLPPPSDA